MNAVPQEAEARSKNWAICGLNERLRFYRCKFRCTSFAIAHTLPDDPGQRFERHYDGHYPRNSNEMSLMTIIIYLNDQVEGGHTNFYTHTANRERVIPVKPKRGAALIFYHGPHRLSPEHEGSDTVNGRKYVLRSDIMYRKQ
jgi:hypothetical protein